MLNFATTVARMATVVRACVSISAVVVRTPTHDPLRDSTAIWKEGFILHGLRIVMQ